MYKFDKEGKSFVVNQPETPSVWYNTFTNKTLTARFSVTGQGSCFSNEPDCAQLTPGYRYIYIRDNRTNVYWSPLYDPVQESLDFFRSDMEPGQSVITTEKHGIKCRITYNIDQSLELEYLKLAIHNTIDRELDLSVFTVFPFAVQSGTMGCKAMVLNDLPVIYGTCVPYYTRFEDWKKISRMKTLSYCFAQPVFDHHECSVSRFFGATRSHHRPLALEQKALSGSSSYWEDSCAAMQHNIRLLPRGEQEILFYTGYLEGSDYSREPLENIYSELTREGHSRYRTNLEKSKAHWDYLLEVNKVSLPDRELQYQLNYWIPRQLLGLTINSRGLAVPSIRNVVQDLQGCCLYDHQQTAEGLARVMEQQRSDGFLPHSMKNNQDALMTGLGQLLFYDSAVWLAPAVCSYLQYSGDMAYLNRKIPFNDGSEGSVFEHCLKIFEMYWNNRGPQGLLLLGDGDWNDPLNGPGRKGKGESVWLSMALVYAIGTFLPLCENISADEASSMLQEMKSEMKKVLQKTAWDGEWWVRGFDDNSKPFGTESDKYGRIWLNAQTWAILSGVAEGEFLTKTLNSIDTLLESPAGPVTLAPPFPEFDERIGKVSIKPAGANENGSVYCHAAMFKVLSDYKTGRKEKGYDLLKKIIDGQGARDSSLWIQNPILVPNFYLGPGAGHEQGRSSLHFGTGTVSWIVRILHETVLGIKPDFEKIHLDPQAPPDWDQYKVERRFRGCRYTFHFRKSTGETAKGITVNGKPVLTNFITYSRESECSVEIIY